MKTILILGSTGMLGHMVELYLKQKNDLYDIETLNRKDCDFTNFTLLDGLILDKTPDVVINCIGILNNENDIHKYADLNTVLPRFLNHLSKRDGWKLIQISTNCVFKDIGPNYPIKDPDADDWYGMSKAFGELPSEENNITIRTSIIGPELKEDGQGLMHRFLTGKIKNGYENILWNGVTTLQLAKYIENILANGEDGYGLRNYVSEQPWSKYDILHLINDIFDLNKELNKEIRNVHQSILSASFFADKTLSHQILELKEFMFDNREVYEKIYPEVFK